MFQFIFGFIAGAYTAQRYNIPDIENVFSELFTNLKNLEKEKNTNNNTDNSDDKNTINNKENQQENNINKEKKKFKFFF